MMNGEGVLAELRRIVGDAHVLDSEAARKSYDCDAYTVDKALPVAVVLPRSTEEVSAIVKACNAHGCAYVARGAGTGLSGGALASRGGIVVSTKRMKDILEVDVDNACLLAQAGIANKRISDYVRSSNLHFAPDPSSQSVSTLGGNIAENSGGPHTLKYGVTSGHILGITMVDEEGEIRRLGGKMGVGPELDLLSLLVGGEGTLGVITEAWVKLTPLPRFVETCLISFNSVRAATQAVSSLIARGIVPAALELMDSRILQALRLAFDFEFDDEAAAVLLVEVDAMEEPDVREQLEAILHIVSGEDARSVQVAQDERERARLWMVRKKGIGAMGRLAPSIVTHDGVIPRSKLPEMLDYVYEVAELHHLGVANIFHAGDGNLHPCFYFDDRSEQQVQAVVEAGEAVVRKCIELGGSVTGEHGIGVEKIDLLSIMFDSADLRLQQLAKETFVSDSLCNPCKVLPNQKGCIEHRMRSRGAAT